MIRPNHFGDWGETRRFKALELRDSGWSQPDIAAALGVTRGAVSQWLRRADVEGRDSLRHRRGPGRTSRLNRDQAARLMTLLMGSPQAAGLQSEAWTRGVVRDLILREFGVSYHPAHVSRLVRSYGASLSRVPMRVRR